MTIKNNVMSFPQVPQVPHKSLILLGRHCWAVGSAGCPQVIDFIRPQVFHPLSLLLRSRLRPAIGAGAQPSKTIASRRRNDGRSTCVVMAERGRVEMVAIHRRRGPGIAVPELWVLPEALTQRGFRPPDLSLGTEISQGGYNQTPPRAQGIPCTRARADRAGGGR